MKTTSAIAIVGFVSLALLALGQAPLAAQEQVGDSNAVQAKFEVAKNGNCILVPMRIRDKEYRFVLDTGTKRSAFDTVFSLGEPLTVESVLVPSGSADLPLYRAPEANVGSLPFRVPEPILGLDFTTFRKAGFPIYGLIGMDFLSNYVVTIDFDQGILHVSPSSARTVAQPIPIRLDERRLAFVNVHTADGNIEFLIDTGHVTDQNGLLERTLFNLRAAQNRLKVVSSAIAVDASGHIIQRVGQLNELSLGGFQLDRLCFGEANFSALGLGFWSRFNVTFDFPKKVMYLTKSKNFDRPGTWDRSGLHIVRDDGKTVVHSIDRGSVAERGGIKANDEIVSLLGQKAADVSMFEIRRHFATPKTEIPLVIRRAGKDYQTTLKLAE